ncbi:YggT family protein [Tepidimonas taiwanensis]|uniref:YGGT family protein n=1 Tax=Tepidimonas taiwanensis TaxID=307486 RepID=A0A554X7V6_9BURK|nr:YggT family protein [Tepidimonas taiwanensis]MCX7692718.1 YggT family protein [Tepidimonas taiwanensis]MDM7464402.1 YggT family protein [Tepidimonas taiwanensis]TSE31914.1 YGGT family protein [Tepidimonas taiwanensis]UBQ06311.1 YggT family protein [Tepidimonas taiwanensis]
MRILQFLLDTVFFILVGAALLRGWMNTRRLRMASQPGPFVIAVTDWIVQPVRRTLPRVWAQANVDWGSFVAAVLLALAYAGCVHLLWGGALPDAPSLGFLVTVPVLALQWLLRTALQGLMLLMLLLAVLTWVQPFSPLIGSLGRLLEPLLAPMRRLIPTIGGVDLSILVWLILLQVGLMLLG